MHEPFLAARPNLIPPAWFDAGAAWSETGPTLLRSNGIVGGALEAEVILNYSGGARLFQALSVLANTKYRLSGNVSRISTGAVPFGISVTTTANAVLARDDAGSDDGGRSFPFLSGVNTTLRFCLAVTGTNETVGDKFYLSNFVLRRLS